MNNVRPKTPDLDDIWEGHELRAKLSRNRPRQRNMREVSSGVDTTPGTSKRTTIHATNRDVPIGAP